jgi:hypothetical protein
MKVPPLPPDDLNRSGFRNSMFKKETKTAGNININNNNNNNSIQIIII